MKSPIRILLLEDDDNDAALIQSALAAEGVKCVTLCVKTKGEFLGALKSANLDLILSDYSLPAFDGFNALKLARDRCPDIPFILVSGKLGEELAIDALKSGATDYVLKDRLDRLVPAVRRALLEVKERLIRKKSDAKRKVANRKLVVLTQRLVEAQETERRKIARELHDEIGQNLTGIQLNLQALLQLSGGEVMKRRLEDCLNEVENLLGKVQDMSLDLRPSLLDDLGLESALVWLTNRQAALAGLHGKVHVAGLRHRLDPVIETECFRVAQEALTNVMRHAKAHEVNVDLRAKEGQLHLRVKDDGVGFDVTGRREIRLRGASLGLVNMKERSELAGGGMKLTSTPEQGTEVHAWFPLKWHILKN